LIGKILFYYDEKGTRGINKSEGKKETGVKRDKGKQKQVKTQSFNSLLSNPVLVHPRFCLTSHLSPPAFVHPCTCLNQFLSSTPAFVHTR